MSICFIPKILRPIDRLQFRGKLLSDCTGKLCNTTLMRALQRWLMQSASPTWHRVQVFAYEEAVGCEQLAVATQLIYSKRVEWANSAPILILSADVLTAFASVTPSSIDKAMQYWKVPPDLRAAVSQ